ncbi:MAG: SRPBCC family protein [Caldimonas sp.]
MELSRSVLVPYCAEDMFDLLERAESYPQFLPWCTAATILERSDDWVAARLEFCYLQVRFGLQTHPAPPRAAASIEPCSHVDRGEHDDDA